jgi:hypothetical protein
MDAVLCCLIWDADSAPWKLKVRTDRVISGAPPEKLTYEDERPEFGVFRQALYDLLYAGFANAVEINRYELTFTGLAAFTPADIGLWRALEKGFGSPVMLTRPITELPAITVE